MGGEILSHPWRKGKRYGGGCQTPVGDESSFMAISAYVKPLGLVGVKWVASYRYNMDRYDLPTHISTIILNDATTAATLAVMDGNLITSARTGAVTAVGAKYLARSESKIVGIIGAGVQARSNLLALDQILDIETVKVTSRKQETRDLFAQEMTDKLGLNIYPVDSSDEVARDSDIIVSTAPEASPYVLDDLAKRGVLVITLGSHIQTDRLFPKRADKIVVDDLEGFYRSGVGHFAEYVKEEIINEKDIYAQLSDIVIGKKPGRTSDNDRIWFSHVGMAVHDVIVAYEVFGAASEKKIGLEGYGFLGEPNNG